MANCIFAPLVIYLFSFSFLHFVFFLFLVFTFVFFVFVFLVAAAVLSAATQKSPCELKRSAIQELFVPPAREAFPSLF